MINSICVLLMLLKRGYDMDLLENAYTFEINDFVLKPVIIECGEWIHFVWKLNDKSLEIVLLDEEVWDLEVHDTIENKVINWAVSE